MTVKEVPVTVSVFLVRRMLAALEARGISPIEFLSAARIRPDIVDDETACVTAQCGSPPMRTPQAIMVVRQQLMAQSRSKP